MKRLAVTSVAAVALLAAVSSFGQSNVYSRNAVGAIRVDIPPAGGFAMCAFNFLPLGGSNQISVGELFGTNQLVKSNIPLTATRIYKWDPTKGTAGGYITVFQKVNGTVCNASSPYPETNVTLNVGEGFWLQSPGNSVASTSVYIMGEVLASNVFSRVQPTGFLMIGNPYSAPLNINDTNLHWVADGAVAGNVPLTSDSLYIWNGSGYNSFFLRSTDSNWHHTTSPYPLASNGVIAVGGGAWYKARGSFTNNLVRPYPWW